MECLSSIISAVDAKDQLNFDHPECTRIQRAVEDCVCKLHDHICEKSSIYEGELVDAGSVYDELKVGKPDEFDFNFILKKFVYGKTFTIQPSGFNGSRNLWRTPQGSTIFKKIQLNLDFAKQLHVNNKTINVGTKRNPEYILSQVEFKNEFITLIAECIPKIKTNRLLTIIGIVDLSGPAVSIDLKWHGRKFPELKINIDLCLVIELPFQAVALDPITLFPEHHALHYVVQEYSCQKYTYGLVPFVGERGSHCWRVSCNFLESFIFQSHTKRSNVKTLLRLTKILRNKIVTDDSLKLIPSESLFIISTYVLKQIVFHMLKEIDVEITSKETIAHRFIELLQRWFEATKAGYVENFFFPGHKIKVPDMDCTFEAFATIIYFIQDGLDGNNVSKQDQSCVFLEIQNIYDELKRYYIFE